MSNIGQIFKDEILRLSRKEVRTAIKNLTAAMQELKRQNAFLKKEIAGLQRQLVVREAPNHSDAESPASLPQEN